MICRARVRTGVTRIWWPSKGRVVEIYGPKSSGKTTLALHSVAEGAEEGRHRAFIDAEHALDPVYARKLGVNVENC